MRIDFRAQVTLASLARDVREFGHWWLSELLAVLPQDWRGPIESRFVRPAMRPAGGHWILSWPGSSLPDISIDPSAPITATRGALQKAPHTDRAVTLELPERDVLRRTVRLPAAARMRVHSAIELQLDHYSPFRNEDVAFDCVVLPSSSQDGEVDVDVAIVPRATLVRYKEWLSEIGLRLAEFRTLDSAHRFGLATLDWHWDHTSFRKALVATGCILWIAAYFLAPGLRRSEVEAETAKISGLRIISGDAADAKDKLDRLTEPAKFLAQKERAPPALDALQSLTLGFPNNVRLSSLVIEGNRVRATGVADDAYLVMDILKRSARFSDVTLSGPVEHLPGGRNRFTVDLALPANAGKVASR